MPFYEKRYRANLIYDDSVLVEANSAQEADIVFAECFDGNTIDPEQVICSGIFIEPLEIHVFKKDLINNIDDCEILRRE